MDSRLPLIVLAFSMLCAMPTQGQPGHMLEIGGGATHGGLYPYETVYKGRQAAPLWGKGFQVGYSWLKDVQATAPSIGIRFSYRSNRQEVQHDTVPIISPSSFRSIRHGYDGVVTVERFMVGLPIAVRLRLSQHFRLLLGAEPRYSDAANIVERGELTITEKRYSIPDYALISEETTTQSYTYSPKFKSGSTLQFAFSVSLRWQPSSRIWLGPDVAVIGTFGGGLGWDAVTEAMLAFSIALDSGTQPATP